MARAPSLTLIFPGQDNGEGGAVDGAVDGWADGTATGTGGAVDRAGVGTGVLLGRAPAAAFFGGAGKEVLYRVIASVASGEAMKYLPPPH
jgi:hypothetical protein